MFVFIAFCRCCSADAPRSLLSFCVSPLPKRQWTHLRFIGGCVVPGGNVELRTHLSPHLMRSGCQRDMPATKKRNSPAVLQVFQERLWQEIAAASGDKALGLSGSRNFLSCAMPRAIRDLTVPMGTSRMAAMSL